MEDSPSFVLLYSFVRKRNKQAKKQKPPYLTQGDEILGVAISIFKKLKYIIGLPVLDSPLEFYTWLAAWSLVVDLGNAGEEAIIQLMQRNPAKEQEGHPSPPRQLRKIGVYRELSFLGICFLFHCQRP